MTTVILFIIGIIVGSFLNVLGLRWNSGLSLGGRSFCTGCGKKLKWYELVPLLSFLFLGGRCSGCHVKISWQYPLVEAWTGLVFATIFNLPTGEAGFQFSILQNFLVISVFCIYIAITIYDLRHKIIPDAFVYIAIVLSLLLRIVAPSTSGDWLAGPILFSFFALIWFFSKGRAMGFGDAKLALSIGLLLGAAGAYSGVVLAFWIGAAFGIIYILLSKFYPLLRDSKGITMKSEIPFAPFLVVGAWLALIFNLDLLHVSIF